MEFDEVDIQAIRFFSSKGGLLISTINPDVTCSLPEGAVTIGLKSFIRASVQVINIDEALVHKHMGKDATVSPILILEPVRRKFHKPLVKNIPIPGLKHKKTDKKDVRILCSITGSGENSDWEDITSVIDDHILREGLETSKISMGHVITGRFVVVCCDNSIMDIPETMTEMFKSYMNGGLFSACNNQPNVDLLKAARCGDLSALKACLTTDGIDINYQNKGGQTALHLACKDGHTRVVEELMSQGADHTLFTKRGNAAIHLASYYGNTAIVDVLLNSGCDSNLQSQHGFPALYPAVLEMHCDIIKLLISHNADTTWTSQDGLSLLMVAVFSTYDKDKTVAVLELLLQEVDITRLVLSSQMEEKGFHCHGEALLHSVITRQAAGEMIGPVRQRLANLSTELLQEDMASIESCNHDLKVFLTAVKDDDMEKVTTLLSQDTDVNLSTERNVSGLHCACLHGHISIADKLIQAGADVNQQTQGEFTCLHLACLGGYTGVVKALLHAGVEIATVNKHGLTASDVAIEMYQIHILEIIKNFKHASETKTNGEIEHKTETCDKEDEKEEKAMKKGCCMF